MEARRSPRVVFVLPCGYSYVLCFQWFEAVGSENTSWKSLANTATSCDTAQRMLQRLHAIRNLIGPTVPNVKKDVYHRTLFVEARIGAECIHYSQVVYIRSWHSVPWL